jgi:type II secretory pathway component PulF
MKIRYTAKDFNGKTVKGIVEAGSLKAAAGLLKEQSLIPITVLEEKKGVGLEAINAMLGRVTDSDITTFTRQLSTMITAGLPLTDALNLLKAQSSTAFSNIIGAVLLDVQSGISLSVALAKHPKVFGKVYIALVKAGEAAGVMEKVLNRLADTAERGREFKGKVVGAMIYPVIILVGMVAVMLMMVVMVIPKMKDLYADFGEELPFATKMILAVSDFTINYWWVLLAGTAGLVFLVRSALTSKTGQEIWGRWIFKLPVMGPLVRQTVLSEFTRTSALLLSAGVSVVESLRIVSESVGNVVVEKDIRRIANQVEKGFPVSISFSESEIFPPIIGQMVAVGEETGKLDDVLEKISHYFESESEQKIKGLTTAIEPIILMVMAVGIGFLLYAIIMPIYGITNKV